MIGYPSGESSKWGVIQVESRCPLAPPLGRLGSRYKECPYILDPFVHLSRIMSAQPKVANQLHGKKVVVLGGTSGIGFSVASAVVEEGGSVVIASSNQGRVQQAIERLTDPSTQYNADKSRVTGFPINLAGSGVEAELKAFYDKVGKFDHLVYTSADAISLGGLEAATYESIVKAGEIRLFSAILAVKNAVYGGYLNSGGSVVLTTGSVAEKPLAGWSVPTSFAAALPGLARNLALDLSPKNLRVNAVSPGGVVTEMWDPMPKEQREGMMSHMASQTLTHHVASPAEVAQAYLYLFKDTNTTGQTISTNGGGTLGPPPS